MLFSAITFAALGDYWGLPRYAIWALCPVPIGTTVLIVRAYVQHIGTGSLPGVLEELGRCPGCGYNLRELPERVCPECGATARNNRDQAPEEPPARS